MRDDESIVASCTIHRDVLVRRDVGRNWALPEEENRDDRRDEKNRRCDEDAFHLRITKSPSAIVRQIGPGIVGCDKPPAYTIRWASAHLLRAVYKKKVGRRSPVLS